MLWAQIDAPKKEKSRTGRLLSYHPVYTELFIGWGRITRTLGSVLFTGFGRL